MQIPSVYLTGHAIAAATVTRCRFLDGNQYTDELKRFTLTMYRLARGTPLRLRT